MSRGGVKALTVVAERQAVHGAALLVGERQVLKLLPGDCVKDEQPGVVLDVEVLAVGRQNEIDGPAKKGDYLAGRANELPGGHERAATGRGADEGAVLGLGGGVQ